MKDKTVTITNFTQTDYFVPNEEEHPGLCVLTAARVSSTNNIKNYIEAIHRLKQEGITNVRYDWFGKVQAGHEMYAKECETMIANYGLNDIVSFHPATNDIKLQYQKCDIFMLSSIYEGFPNVICEAMSCGKPVICSRVCDNPRIVQEGLNGTLFDPASVEEMAEKLRLLLNMSKEQRKEWGERSREIAMTLFSEDVFVNKYISLIEQ